MTKIDETILKRYADVIIKFALNDYKGIKKGDKVYVRIPEAAREFLPYLQKSILESGGHMILEYIPDGILRDFFDIGSPEQLSYTPKKYVRSLISECDHVVRILSESDPKQLEGIDPKLIMLRQKNLGFFRSLMQQKENKGKLTWNISLFPTKAMAKEAKMTLEEYWEEIVHACFLDESDPVSKWREVTKQVEDTKSKLNKLDIKTLNVLGDGVDLSIGLGEKRRWAGGGGRNIPSFEVFTSPDCRVADGYISFSEPLYIYDNLVDGITLEFKDGKVVKASAKKGEKVLKQMIAEKGANRLGEFSLTDKRLSRIHRFMAETLFDENTGGKYGNMHLALGQSFPECFSEGTKDYTTKTAKKYGFNESHVHTDIVTRKDRTVTAILRNGTKKVIYQNGEFTI